MGKKVGIDLGTTYSVVSYVDETGTIVNIESEEGEKTTPSVVYFDPDGQTAVVGTRAREAGALNPEFLVERVKQFMDDPDYQLEMHGTTYSASAVSSIILKKLITDAENALGGEEIDGAVITCPAYFGDVAKDATRKAGENVILSNGKKLNVMRIIDEPTAAAIAYGNSRREDMHKTVLIYDLGGGTFDCTVMKLDFEGTKKEYRVVTTNGNHKLGGKNWDDTLAEYVMSEFCNATGCDIELMRQDFEVKAWFSENVEKAKKQLTKMSKTTLTPSFDGQKYRVEIERTLFDEITDGLFNETITLINQMMDQANLNFATDIDEIILIGGSTRMPQVEEKLTAIYNKPIMQYDPDKAVSNGAALVASGMDAGNSSYDHADSSVPSTPGKPSNLEPTEFTDKDGNEGCIFEVCTKSYCLRYYSGGQETYVNLIKKDTPKPATGTTAFLLPGLVIGGGDGSGMTSEIGLLIMENDYNGDEVSRDQCVEIYEETPLKFDTPIPSDTKVSVELYVDISGTLTLILTETDTGRTHKLYPERIGGGNIGNGMDAAAKITLG